MLTYIYLLEIDNNSLKIIIFLFQENVLELIILLSYLS